QAAGLSRTAATGTGIQAESSGRIGFLSRDYPAAWPLGPTIHAAECHGAHYPVPVHNGCPHLVIQAAGLSGSRGIKCGFERTVVGKIFARFIISFFRHT